MLGVRLRYVATCGILFEIFWILGLEDLVNSSGLLVKNPEACVECKVYLSKGKQM